MSGINVLNKLDARINSRHNIQPSDTPKANILWKLSKYIKKYDTPYSRRTSATKYQKQWFVCHPSSLQNSPHPYILHRPELKKNTINKAKHDSSKAPEQYYCVGLVQWPASAAAIIATA
jgi:hypothetical protein